MKMTDAKSYVIFKEMNERHLQGDHVNDNELLALYKIYKHASDSLFYLGDRYHHAWLAAINEVRRMEDIAKYRNIKLQ